MTNAEHDDVVLNDLGQPIGWPLDTPHADVGALDTVVVGRYCRLERLDADAHGADLHDAYSAATDDGDWTYLPYGPFAEESDLLTWLRSVENSADPMFFTITDLATDRRVGVASYLRIDERNASVEVGHIHLSRRLQRTPAATEAMYLMMKRAFEGGFRRYEWKCDALNAPSQSAATRLGFRYEGTFRQATHYKRRNRDTAWFAIVDGDWPALDAAFSRWLDPSNFDDGKQLTSLRCRAT